MKNHTEQRQYFRLRYNIKEVMPTLRVQSREFNISEISEKGIRVIVRDSSLFRIDDSLTGEVLLNSLETNIPVTGKVLRKIGNEVIFLLSDGLSFKQMIAEQRYMRKNHPKVFPKNSQLVSEEE
ncbi:PilZ domain-containing protein [Vibrio ziniensis]|uniref:PilZ domain-containing protein n=1 Tax=Vibrio ziniensis TaxID=2711221 RepID=A0A6G7CLZ4_9VIBR|nr:PilZ domain-containing protein [Vibrio ziniensis]QIH43090.1 PilZ domain-containing protein [Vibrio ziniensis]